MLGPYGGITLVRCGDCGLVHASAGYGAPLLDDHYADRARRTASGSTTGPRAGSERKRPALALYDRLTQGRLLAPTPGARALDIGCNTGLLLDLLREAGYRTVGIERSPSGAEAVAAGHEVHALDIEAGLELRQRFDVVTMTHVLEHLRQPTRALEWVREHLHAQGLAIVEVPNWGDLARPLWGTRYRPLELGDHLSFFERETLAGLARRAGLRVRALWSAPQARSLLFPSLLTGVDLGLDLVRRLRRRSTPEAAVGVAADRVHGGGGRWRHAVVSAVLDGLDRLDPPLERLVGSDWDHGANLVAVLDATATE